MSIKFHVILQFARPESMAFLLRSTDVMMNVFVSDTCLYRQGTSGATTDLKRSHALTWRSDMRSNINGTSFLTALRHAAVTLAAIALVTMAVATASRGAQPQGNSRLAERVREQLVTLPYYGVFDNLAFKVQGDTVVLYGQVVRPSTRSDAEHRVARIEGVDRVINQIQVLPLSPMDASIRRRVYRAVFRQDGLYRYALGANPSIHIIVN